MQAYHHTLLQLIAYAIFLLLTLGASWITTTRVVREDEIAAAAYLPDMGRQGHAYGPITDSVMGNTSYRLYSRKLVWLRHVFLTVAVVSVICSAFTTDDQTWLNRAACTMHVLALSLLIYLDGVHLVGQSLQKRFLALYLSLVLLGGLDLLLQPLSALPLLLFLLSLASSILSFLVCYCNPYKLQSREPTAEATANLWPYVSFSYLHAILIHPGMAKKSLEYEDIPGLCDDDSAEVIAERFEKILLRHHDQQQQTSAGHRREEGDMEDEQSGNDDERTNSKTGTKANIPLTSALLALVRPLWLEQGFFQLIASCSQFLAPLALEKILIFVEHRGDASYEKDGFLKVNVWWAVLMLFLGPALKSFGDGQNYLRGRHIGIRMKAALISTIYQKSLQVDLGASKESVGKLNNLISVDVSQIQEFWCYSHYLWSTALEITIATGMLFLVLGKAALAGIITMALSMSLGFYLGTWLEVYQAQLMANKDKRMSIMNEILNSVRIIKFFAWEAQFMDRVNASRLVELASLLTYSLTGSFLYVIWDIVPSIVAVVAFLTYSYILGHTLTPDLGFTALTLFNILRFPLSVLPGMVTSFVQCRASLKRILDYLQTDNVAGLPTARSSQSPRSSNNLIGSISFRNLTIGWRPITHEENDGDDKNKKVDPKGEHQKTHCFQFIASSILDCVDCVQLSQKRMFSMLCFDRSSNIPTTRGGPQISHQIHSSSLPSDVIESESSPQIILENVNLDIVPGTLNVIIGSTGAGKTTLLQGLLGEALVLGGERLVYGSLSYSSQSAWIQNATLRENILFGSDYDEERYEAVLHACALKADLALLPGGDQTEIGEKGVNLSGGQQQRVSLARAAYARSDVILLDDPLSAVDAHVGEHIFRELILGFLKGRTVLLITHSLSLALPHADQILCIDGEMRSLSHSAKPLELFEALQASYGKDGDAEVVAEEEQVAVGLGIAPKTTSSSNKTIIQQYLPSEDGCDKDAVLSPLSNSICTTSSSSATPSSNSFMKSVYHILKTEFQQPSSPLLNVSPAENRIENENLREVLLEESVEIILDHLPQMAAKQHLHASLSNKSVASSISSSKPPSAGDNKITTIETKNVGEVSWSTYNFYFQACGGHIATGCLILSAVWIAVSWYIQSYCLGQWMQSMTASEIDHHEVMEQLTFYLLSVGSIVIAHFFRAAVQIVCGMRASERMHANLIRSVLLAPVGWFDATPIGRIINRFSQDVATVDSELMYHLLGFLDCLVGTIQVVAVISWFLPQLLIAFFPIICFTIYVAYQYIHVSRELKRLESLKKTPVFVLFSETLQGLPIIRCFSDQSGKFLTKACHYIDQMNQCHLFLWICNRWLNFRMQCLGALVSGSVAAAIVFSVSRAAQSAVTSHHPLSILSSASAGIALMYSLSFCDNLTFLARSHADCQMNLNSVERIEEYSEITSERYDEDVAPSSSTEAMKQLYAPYIPKACTCCLAMASSSSTGSRKVSRLMEAGQTREEEGDVEMGLLQSSPLHRPSSSLTGAAEKSNGNVPSSWPSHGQVTFRHLSLRYASSSSPVLRDVSFDIPAGSKVGVVGRTGAGKSSLITALFRLVEPESGELWIDGVDVLRLPLQRLRSRLAIVPQEPTLFRGSLRSNMDPFGEHSDEEIWGALRAARLEEKLWSYLPSGGSEEAKRREEESGGGSGEGVNLLDSLQVAEKGSNFSLGQRQLLCMARAILRKAKVLVLDECTASVDHDTDAMIQETVRYGLSACTVICIAHRLHTVAYYDRILLLERGQVQEFGCPYELLEDSQSAFHALCQASGAFEDLRTIARQAAQSRGVAQ